MNDAKSTPLKKVKLAIQKIFYNSKFLTYTHSDSD